MLPEPIRQSGTEVSPRAPLELTSPPGTDDAVKPTNAVEQEILKYYQAQFRSNEPPSLLDDSDSKPTLPPPALPAPPAATKQPLANPLPSVPSVVPPTVSAPAIELPQAPPMTKTPEPALSSVPTRGVTNEPLSLPSEVPIPTRTPAQNKPAMKPLQVQVRTGAGDPIIEIRDGDALLLKFTCSKLAMQVQAAGLPLPDLTGQGKVRVHGCGIDGVCDQLVLSPDSGDVSLRGNVRLTCFRDDSSAEVTAEMLKFQLRAGDADVKSAASTVVPAGTKMPYAE